MSSLSIKSAFCDLSTSQLADWLLQRDQPAFRASQIRRWLFGKRVESFEAMHDLPQELREQLCSEFDLFQTDAVAHQIAQDRTEKLLLKLTDGKLVECVLMRETGRRTICVSTQVGCAMGCVFCASGLLGRDRNLTIGEILEQVLKLDRLVSAKERITNVVVMGIGEPLANLEALLPALEAMQDKERLGLGNRRITISTVGLPEKIYKLANCGHAYNLAVSLHAPNDALRNELVPANKNIGIDAILAAADDYFSKTGRRVTYEYVLLRGRNDTLECARELAALLKGRNAHVNLISMNLVAELEQYEQPALWSTREFQAVLEQAGIATTIRKRKGADIDAACGQLRLQHSE